MATYTASTFVNNQPKSVHVGTNSVSGQYNFGAAVSSVGDVIFLAKIPNGAKFVNIEEDHSTGATAQGVSFGLASGGPGGSATYSCFIASGAQATVNRRNVLGIPENVSLSANDPNSYGILAAMVESGSATASLIINFNFSYRLD